MKKISRFTSLLLCLVLIFCNFSFPIFAEDSITEIESTIDLSILEKPDNIFNKIHFYFNSIENFYIDDINELNNATDTLKQDYSSASTYGLNNNDSTSNKVEITVQFDSPYTQTQEFIEFNRERAEIDSLEDLRSFRARLNAFSKEYHDALFESNIQSLSEFNYNEIHHVDYSPFAVMNINAENISSNSLLTLASSENVTNISISPENKEIIEESSSFDPTLEAINAYNIVANEEYKGLGVKIGIYEVGGIRRNSLNWGIDLIEKNSDIAKDDHATQVSAVLMQLAPYAQYFHCSPNDHDIGISWFIDQGCDIVNCSFVYSTNIKLSNDTYELGPKGYFYNIDGIYDYQIATSFVTVVAASGNFCNDTSDPGYNPYNQVTSPGYGYNVITVGGVRNIGTSNTPVFEHHPGASFDNTPLYVKPNISAMFDVNIPNVGIISGTSFAAPQVTASIALLMESNRSFSVWPEKTLSRLTSTAKKTADYSNDKQYFDNKVGAGMLDLESAIENTLHWDINHTDDDNVPGSEVARLQLNLPANVELSVAAVWAAAVALEDDDLESIYDIDFTDYELYLYAPGEAIIDSNGNIIEPIIKSNLNNNVELIRYTTSTAGVYTLLVYQYSSRCYITSDDWIMITYNY